jgi:hypothetical protein
MSVDTLPELLQPLMKGCSLRLDHCAICGRTYPLNQHHIVRRGAGKMFREGHELKKPTITLCGNGNTSGCHGLAHQNRLHFRWVQAETGVDFRKTAFGSGHWEYLITDKPTKYQDALEMEGWMRVNG